MTATFSKTQIDRLGDRLREGSAGEANLRLLDDYRRSFGEVYEAVVRTIREQLQLEPTGRPAKSTSSIIEKLGRETIRLSQIQDIAGCRVVVADVTEQDRIIASLRTLFPEATIVDRRTNPSHGYRAVHVIVSAFGKLIEIQVRSALQHLWAELSEKLSDTDPSIKYGGGEEQTRQMLAQTSELVAEIEKIEIMLAKRHVSEQQAMALQPFRTQLVQVKEQVKQAFVNYLNEIVRRPEKQKGQGG